MVVVVAEPFFQVFGLVPGYDADGYVFVDVGIWAARVDVGLIVLYLALRRRMTESLGCLGNAVPPLQNPPCL
jgi:hypothetical protein